MAVQLLCNPEQASARQASGLLLSQEDAMRHRQMNKRERRAWKADVLNELRRPDDAYLARPTRLGMAGRANRTLTQLRR